MRRQGKSIKHDKIAQNRLNQIITIFGIFVFQNVVYVYVPKQADLGRACGVSRNIVAATVLRDPDGPLADKIQKLQDKIESIVE